MITVALPTWNSSPILWLQLESLCRQVDAPEFEVIVMEDPSDNFAGEDYVMQYSDRIQNLRYIQLDKWITLGDKWRRIAQEANYENYILAASDNYSPPDRLKVTNEMLQDSDWFDVRTGLFYNVLAKKSGTWVAPNAECTGLWMGTKTEYIRALKGDGPPKGVDKWIRSQIDIKRKTSLQVMDGVHTDGYNTISINRKSLYSRSRLLYQKSKIFIDPTQKIKDLLPKDILTRLNEI